MTIPQRAFRLYSSLSSLKQFVVSLSDIMVHEGVYMSGIPDFRRLKGRMQRLPVISRLNSFKLFPKYCYESYKYGKLQLFDTFTVTLIRLVLNTSKLESLNDVQIRHYKRFLSILAILSLTDLYQNGYNNDQCQTKTKIQPKVSLNLEKIQRRQHIIIFPFGGGF